MQKDGEDRQKDRHHTSALPLSASNATSVVNCCARMKMNVGDIRPARNLVVRERIRARNDCVRALL